MFTCILDGRVSRSDNSGVISRFNRMNVMSIDVFLRALHDHRNIFYLNLGDLHSHDFRRLQRENAKTV